MKKIKKNTNKLKLIPTELFAIITSYCTSKEWYHLRRTCKNLDNKLNEEEVLFSVSKWYIYNGNINLHLFHYQKYVKNLIFESSKNEIYRYPSLLSFTQLEDIGFINKNKDFINYHLLEDLPNTVLFMELFNSLVFKRIDDAKQIFQKDLELKDLKNIHTYYLCKRLDVFPTKSIQASFYYGDHPLYVYFELLSKNNNLKILKIWIMECIDRILISRITDRLLYHPTLEKLTLNASMLTTDDVVHKIESNTKMLVNVSMDTLASDISRLKKIEKLCQTKKF